MRGKGVWLAHDCGRKRITPAYAGKSSLFDTGRIIEWDHPRLCGEKEADVQFLFNPLGSPPPMRGKANTANAIPENLRITPAYAGKRSACENSGIRRKDHPRLCGEKS